MDKIKHTPYTHTQIYFHKYRQAGTFSTRQQATYGLTSHSSHSMRECEGAALECHTTGAIPFYNRPRPEITPPRKLCVLTDAVCASEAVRVKLSKKTHTGHMEHDKPVHSEGQHTITPLDREDGVTHGHRGRNSYSDV